MTSPGNIPQPAKDVVGRIQHLERTVRATQKTKPTPKALCSAALGALYALPSGGGTTYAQGGWGPGSLGDPYGMIGSNGIYSCITIPDWGAGNYLIRFHSTFFVPAPTSNGWVGGIVALNGQSDSKAIAYDEREFPAASSLPPNRVPVESTTMYPLNAGDFLCWAHYSNVSASVTPFGGSLTNAITEISIHQLS